MVVQIVDLFHPDKIILFGSHAYGWPTSESDVDVLVVMPTKNQMTQACRIRLAVEGHPFPLDLLVRTPEYLRARLDAGDSFMQEILFKGKVRYEKADGGNDFATSGVGTSACTTDSGNLASCALGLCVTKR